MFLGVGREDLDGIRCTLMLGDEHPEGKTFAFLHPPVLHSICSCLLLWDFPKNAPYSAAKS